MIVKPDQMSQGKGIYLTHQLDELPLPTQPLTQNQKLKQPKFVVQEYLRDPYLIDGLKFDIRLYVLVLSADPLKLFLYKDGLVRFGTIKYDPTLNDDNI